MAKATEFVENLRCARAAAVASAATGAASWDMAEQLFKIAQDRGSKVKCTVTVTQIIMQNRVVLPVIHVGSATLKGICAECVKKLITLRAR